jgi:GntR family transcriptional repressor for pyruvate dehydrogenase complex
VGAKQPVYATVQTRLRAFIREEGLEPGARLPSERDLARTLGVSRTSLRQAMTALRVEGLIDVRRGAGIYLLRGADDVVPPIAAELGVAHPELPDVGEVRNALEALAARCAATRRGDDDMAAMVAALRLMEEEIAAGGSSLAGDRAFHQAVLAAAHNDILAKLLDSIADGASRIAEASLQRRGQAERSLTAHRLILDAIVARESEEAQQLMFRHLELTGEIVPAAGNGNAP